MDGEELVEVATLVDGHGVRVMRPRSVADAVADGWDLHTALRAAAKRFEGGQEGLSKAEVHAGSAAWARSVQTAMTENVAAFRAAVDAAVAKDAARREGVRS